MDPIARNILVTFATCIILFLVYCFGARLEYKKECRTLCSEKYNATTDKNAWLKDICICHLKDGSIKVEKSVKGK